MKKIRILLTTLTFLFIIFLGITMAKPPCWGSGEPVYAQCSGIVYHCSPVMVECSAYPPDMGDCWVICYCAVGGFNWSLCRPGDY